MAAQQLSASEIDTKLAPGQMCERLCLVKTSTTFTPGWSDGNDQFFSVNKLWPALKFNSYSELMDQLNKMDTDPRVIAKTKGRFVLAAHESLSNAGMTLAESGFAYLLGKGNLFEKPLVPLAKNDSGELIEDGVIFDFFDAVIEMEAAEGYCASVEFQNAFKIAMTRIELEVRGEDAMLVNVTTVNSATKTAAEEQPKEEDDTPEPKYATPQASASSPPQEEQQKDEPDWRCSRCNDTFPGEKRFYCHCQNCGYLLANDDESDGSNRLLSAEEKRQQILNLDKEKIINKLTLDNYGITYTEEECEILAEVLQKTTTLEVLQLDQPTALLNEKFRNALEQNRTIKELYLHRSGCDDVGAKALADVLKSNETIELIDLSHNEISDSGVKELGAALLIKKSTTKFYFDDLYNYEISSTVGYTFSSLVHRSIDLNSTLGVTAVKYNAEGRSIYSSPHCLPSNALREIMQLAGCEIASADTNIDLKARRTVEEVVILRKVEKFLSDIIRNSITVTEHLRRIEPCPSFVAYALGQFAKREAHKKATSSTSDVKFVQLYRAHDVKGRCKNVVSNVNVFRSDRLCCKCNQFEGCCPNPFDDEDSWERWQSMVLHDSDEETWVDDGDYDDIMEYEDMSLSESLIDDDDFEEDEGPNELNFLEGSLLPWTVNTARGISVPMFDAVYPPVDLSESKVTDQQFLVEVLRPLTADTLHSSYSMYMGFDLDEEDYMTDLTECEEYPILRDAPLIINMLKRATYAFAVASVRENIDWLRPFPQGSEVKVTQREKQLQLEIESLKEEIESMKIPTVDLTNENDEDDIPAAANASSKRRCTEIEQSSSMVTRSRVRDVPVKLENIKAGAIKCPDCNKIILHNGGCHILKCMNHPRWIYFCAHCKRVGEDGSEIIRCDCPRGNTQEDRDIAQAMRNQRAKENPIMLE